MHKVVLARFVACCVEIIVSTQCLSNVIGHCRIVANTSGVTGGRGLDKPPEVFALGNFLAYLQKGMKKRNEEYKKENCKKGMRKFKVVIGK